MSRFKNKDERESIMANPLWLVKLIRDAFPGRFILARLSRVPFIRKLMDRLLFDGDEIYYLPGDKIIGINEELPAARSIALPSMVIDHFIDKAKHLWVMNECICRASTGCKDYPVKYGCLFLGDAVLDINPALGREVTRAEAKAHVKRCRDAGLVQLVGKNKLDAVWLNVGDDTKLLTICNCCPCCCLWRMLPSLHAELARRVTRLDGLVVKVTDKCVGCGKCTEGICFVDAISLVNGKATISTECRGCGRCVETCPRGAIEITFPGPDCLENAIRRLERLVDVE